MASPRNDAEKPAEPVTVPRPEAIALRGIAKKFGSADAVKSVDLTVGHGELVSLLGPSGSGKTTTLMMIGGHEVPSSGTIVIGGRDVTGVPPHLRDIGMVFQHYALFPHLTVEQNIAFPLRMRKVPRSEIARKVRAILELVRLTGLESRYPRQLSGGQSQRVALARALVFDPSILLMDEPLSALDKKLRDEMQFEIKRIQRNLNITTIYVTHDQHEAMVLSDRVAVFSKGRIEQIGTPEELYDYPQTRFVADFLGEMNFLSGRLVEVSGSRCKVTIGAETAVVGRLLTVGAKPGKVSIGVRPEALLIDRGDISDGLNRATGVVNSVEYYGESSGVNVRLPDGQSLLAKPPNTGVERLPTVGKQVTLAWSHDKTMVIYEEAGHV